MQQNQVKVFVGYDSRYPESYAVTVRSIRQHAPDVVIKPLVLAHLQGEGLYTRPTTRDDKGNLHDSISEHPMATEFAITRFLVPHLMGYQGIAVFVDGDFLFRDNINKLAKFLKGKPMAVVKHEYVDKRKTKMQGQAQTNYPRKNWSSLMVFDCGHKANRALDVELVNKLPGRDLHALCWLKDEDIASVPEGWNWLEGHSTKIAAPAAVHFTRGTPEMGVKPASYGLEWQAVKDSIA